MKKQNAFWVVVALGCSVSCESHVEQRAKGIDRPKVKVETAAVTAEQWPQEYEASGTVHARTTAILCSRINGQVLEVHAREGDPVRAAQTLVVLDAQGQEVGMKRAESMRAEAAAAVPELEAAIEASKSNLDLAEVTYRRMHDLYAKKSISNQEFDEAEAHVKVVRANHAMTVARRAQLKSRLDRADQEAKSAAIDQGYTHIEAPFAGTITVRSVEPGSLAVVGTPLLTVERAGAYELHASVEESRARLIRAGYPVRYSLEAVGCEGSGKVAEIVPAVDPQSRSYTVKIALPCGGVHSGMFGRAVFASGTRKVIAVPDAAVFRKGQLQGTFVVEGGNAHQRLLTVGEVKGGRAEVLSGLSEGERVILKAGPELMDGSPIEAKP